MMAPHDPDEPMAPRALAGLGLRVLLAAVAIEAGLIALVFWLCGVTL